MQPKQRRNKLAVLVAAVCVLASVTYAAPTTLTNGVAVTGLSGAAGSETFYKIDVPAGQDTLEIATSGGTGDVDLYVKQGAQPTTTSYDYRPYKVGNNETVDVNNPAAGTWYIMLRGYASYAGVTLKATYSAAISVKALTNGVAVTGLAGRGQRRAVLQHRRARRSDQARNRHVGRHGRRRPLRQERLTADNHQLRLPAVPVRQQRNRERRHARRRDLVHHGPGLYRLSGITLLASYSGSGGHAAPFSSNGVAVTNLSGAANSEKLYRFDLPAGQKNAADRRCRAARATPTCTSSSSPPRPRRITITVPSWPATMSRCPWTLPPPGPGSS